MAQVIIMDGVHNERHMANTIKLSYSAVMRAVAAVTVATCFYTVKTGRRDVFLRLNNESKTFVGRASLLTIVFPDGRESYTARNVVGTPTSLTPIDY